MRSSKSADSSWNTGAGRFLAFEGLPMARITHNPAHAALWVRAGLPARVGAQRRRHISCRGMPRKLSGKAPQGVAASAAVMLLKLGWYYKILKSGLSKLPVSCRQLTPAVDVGQEKRYTSCFLCPKPLAQGP